MREEKTEIQKAVELLAKVLREDPEYRRTWHANISMQFKDECSRQGINGSPAQIADKAADNFLDLLCSY